MNERDAILKTSNNKGLARQNAHNVTKPTLIVNAKDA